MTGTNVLQVLTAYCNMLNILRPAKAPGFAYAWLEIVSHRVFIGRILSLTPQQKGTTPEILSV
jgi:CCR4-NOT transcription complex subunit 1